MDRRTTRASFFMVKIAVGIIIKDDNELDQLKRAVASVKDHVQGIFITATTTPNYKIQKYCKEIGAHYSFFRWVKDFAKARNYNFSQIPPEYEWILWMDTDDVVQGANTFQDAIALATQNNIKAIFARYIYQAEFLPQKIEGVGAQSGQWEVHEMTALSNILIEHLRERLIRNDGTYEWVAPIHETLIEKVPSGKTDYQGFSVIQITDNDSMVSSMWRNIDILEQNVIDNSTDPRPIYYLAKAYFDTKIPEVVYEKAGPECDSITVELIKQYIDTSGWAEERAQAREYLSMIYRERGQFKEALDQLLEALKEDPKFISLYIQIAICYVQLKDWSKALQWVTLAGTVDIPKTTLVINPRDYKSMILEALFHIYLNTGKLEECLKVINDLYKILPTEMNAQRLKDVALFKKRNDLAHYIVKLAYHLNETGQIDEVQNLVNAIPREIAMEPALIDLQNTFKKPRVWDEDEIAIYCGPGFEQWSWKSVAKGVGGSEEAVIYLGKELAKLGWKVTVFGDPQEDAGLHDSVAWRPYYQINWKDEFNILISWRQIGMFDVPGLKAKRAYLWNHDLQNQMTYTPERVKKITKVMFLSNFHRSNVPALSDDKVMITGNGI